MASNRIFTLAINRFGFSLILVEAREQQAARANTGRRQSAERLPALDAASHFFAHPASRSLENVLQGGRPNVTAARRDNSDQMTQFCLDFPRLANRLGYFL